jgi:hypothetical protein
VRPRRVIAASVAATRHLPPTVVRSRLARSVQTGLVSDRPTWTTLASLADTRRRLDNDRLLRHKADDTIHPLSVKDSLFAATNRVTGELDAMPSSAAAVFYVEHLVRPGICPRRRGRSWSC